jgi:hypothetical protein
MVDPMSSVPPHQTNKKLRYCQLLQLLAPSKVSEALNNLSSFFAGGEDSVGSFFSLQTRNLGPFLRGF